MQRKALLRYRAPTVLAHAVTSPSGLRCPRAGYAVVPLSLLYVGGPIELAAHFHELRS
jgi:hypothetical protein